jgi:hypothetical protein
VGQVNNILFRKGIRPGSRKQVVVYSADYNPQGNSYLSIYGWFENPLVEYYIIESWGTWRPPGSPQKVRLKQTVELMIFMRTPELALQLKVTQLLNSIGVSGELNGQGELFTVETILMPGKETA